MTKRRIEFYVDQAVSERVTALAKMPGASKSSVIEAAVRTYLDRAASNELDDRLNVRLDKLSAQFARIGRDQQILSESLAIMIRSYILNMPAVSTADRETRLRAQQQFQAFIDVVSRNVTNRRTFIDDVAKLLNVREAASEPETKQ